jgi:hypothetical protein
MSLASESPTTDDVRVASRIDVQRRVPVSLLALAAQPMPPERTALRARLDEISDWDAVHRAANYHNLTGLLLRRIEPERARVPGEAWQALVAEQRARAARALLATSTLASLVRAFGESGVAVLPYKGPAMAQALYGDASIRVSDDLDLLVAPRDLGRAREVLFAAGYVSPRGWTATQERVLEAGQGHIAYIDGTGRGRPFVELHWRCAALRLPWDLPVGPLLERAVSVELGGVQMPVPCDEDHLLLLALHAARHRWARLEWAGALAVLLTRLDDAAIRRVMAAARAVDGLRALVAGALAAHETLGVPRHPSIADSARLDPEAQRLADEAMAELARDAPDAEVLPHLARCVTTPLSRARLVAVSALWPTVREWEAVRLPVALTPLYVPLRWGRLLVRGRRA